MTTNTIPAQDQTGFLRRVTDVFLWRIANRDGIWQAAALAELERRETLTAREQYFSRHVPTIPVNARDLAAGNVITDRGMVRMVIREVYRLHWSDRVLITFSYTNLVTGEVDEQVRQLPLLAGGAAVRLVRESAPQFALVVA